jgi:hypothetical protein
VTFSGACLPHPLVLGDVYTVSSTTPLSFSIDDLHDLCHLQCDVANAERKGRGAGIFQVRVWGGDTRPSTTNAAAQSSDGMFATPSKAANNRAASARACTRPVIQAHDLAFPSTPSGASHNQASSISSGSAAAHSGKRRASRFASNIAPLPRSDLHESSRSKFGGVELPPRCRSQPL